MDSTTQYTPIKTKRQSLYNNAEPGENDLKKDCINETCEMSPHIRGPAPVSSFINLCFGVTVEALDVEARQANPDFSAQAKKMLRGSGKKGEHNKTMPKKKRMELLVCIFLDDLHA
jgi:hypothetical protein